MDPVDPRAAARVSRWPVLPDGRVLVGLGPGSWVVKGWPDVGADEGARHVVDALGTPGRPQARACVDVLGEGPIAELLRESLPGPAPLPLRSEVRSGAAVLVCPFVVPIGSARRADLIERAVLPVVAQSARVVVGPWTGLPEGPCLHCLDLHRSDRNPQWPTIAAALDDPLAALHPPTTPPVVLTLVAALVALVAAAPERAAPGIAHEVGTVAPHVVTRTWPRHPACTWHGSEVHREPGAPHPPDR